MEAGSLVIATEIWMYIAAMCILAAMMMWR